MLTQALQTTGGLIVFCVFIAAFEAFCFYRAMRSAEIDEHGDFFAWTAFLVYGGAGPVLYTHIALDTMLWSETSAAFGVLIGLFLWAYQFARRRSVQAK